MANRSTKLARMSPISTAVIGGGIAGVTASRLLAVLGDVSQLGRIALFDRGQRLGGRMSSRPINEQFTWRYGYQGLGVYADPERTPRGAQRLEGKDRAEALALLGRATERGTVAQSPLSSSDLLSLPDAVEVHTKCNIVDLRRTAEHRWQLTFEQQDAGQTHAMFDRVVVADHTAATSLLRPEASHIVDRIRGVEYRPMFAYMARLSGEDSCATTASNDEWRLTFSMLRHAKNSPYIWGFTSSDTTARLLTEHPMTDASGRVVPQSKDYRAAIASKLDRVIEASGGHVVESFCHRWGRAIPINPVEGESFIYDAALQVGCCGDMFRVDDCAPFESAVRSAEAMAKFITITPPKPVAKL